MGGVTEVARRTGRSSLARAVADHRSAAAEHRRAAEEHERVLRQLQQCIIDVEVRATRRTLLRAVRRRGGAHAVSFLDEDFLAVADSPAIYEAIVDAAVTVGGASTADLQLYDPGAAVLRMAAHRGFPADFLAFFAVVDAAQPTACAQAWATREPVLVDDVSRSPIFAGRPTRERLLDAGTRSVQSYPLLAPDGAVVGVLSFHGGKAVPRASGAAVVARCAAQVIGQLT
jgi:hypothetical protein